MKLGTSEQQVTCPQCGHYTRVQIDSSNGDQEFYHDCSVCCNPIHLRLHVDELAQKIMVFIDADDEQYY